MTLGTRVPRSVKKAIRLVCAERGVDIRQFVEDAVRELSQYEGNSA